MVKLNKEADWILRERKPTTKQRLSKQKKPLEDATEEISFGFLSTNSLKVSHFQVTFLGGPLVRLGGIEIVKESDGKEQRRRRIKLQKKWKITGFM